MLLRFSLYGFLKNQRYFEPFIILAFLEKGLSFFDIGLLIAFREICVNLAEIPSGAIADLYGRRKWMALSFLAYIISFIIFALSTSLIVLFAAMFFFALGEAFRTGTHKAMIFDWLTRQGRQKEKTKVYGFTRSWSKMGSAVSVVIATALIIVGGNYDMVFWYTTIPYVASIVNILTYPSYLDGEKKHTVSFRKVISHLGQAFKETIKNIRLRRVLTESMLHDGLHTTTKDYIQPVLKQTALALPLFLFTDDIKRTAILVGAVYCILYLLSSTASRQAHRIVERLGNEQKATQWIWIIELALYTGLMVSLFYTITPIAITAFVILAMLQNLWRPILLSRMDAVSQAEMGATVLSVESQAKSLFAMVLAPLLGLAVDHVGMWTIGSVGFIGALMIIVSSRKKTSPHMGIPTP